MATTVRDTRRPAAADGVMAQENGTLVPVAARLVGVTPLLMSAMSAAQLLAIRDRKKPAKSASKPTPHEEAERKLHLLGDGRPCIPVTALMSCLIAAGQFVRLDGKRQISTSKSSVLPGLLELRSIELPLLDAATGKPATWEVDIQQGRNPNGGEVVCIVRPRFDSWRLDVRLVVDQAEIATATIRELFDLAGKRIGLLDFRPQRKGIFGKFRVDQWAEG